MVSLKAVHGPTGKLSPQDWMTAPETKAVVAALRAGGQEVRFVGGCVRDALAHRPVKDVDLATPDKPEAVMRLLAAAGIRTIPTGIEHGSVTALVGDRKFEITTLRRDVETDGRHARVAYTDDWAADADRRDFTINALSATPDGDVYDLNDGIADLAHGRIRFVGIAKRRIGEDVLRLLRYFRFFGDYGRPPADADAIAACRSEASKLSTLSGERVRDELLKILMVPSPADVAVMMRGLGVFAHILPEAGDVGRLRMLSWLETRAIKIDSVQPDALRRLAALIGTDGAGAEVAARRLRLSNRDMLHLVTLVAPPADIGPNLDAVALRRALHRLGAATVRDLALLAWAGELAITPRIPAARTQKWIGILEACDAWRGATFPLTGADVMTALAIPEGPRVGELLGAVEAWWEDGDYQASREQCLAKLRALAGKA
jgi:poly(A) polymerase